MGLPASIKSVINFLQQNQQQIDSNSRKTKMSTEANEQNTKTVNMQYKYVDNDVNNVLNGMQSRQQLPDDVFYTAPIGEREEGHLNRCLEEEINDHLNSPNRTVLIPYLPGPIANRHWVGIVMRFQNNTARNVEYYDSLSGSICPKLVNDLKQIYGNEIEIFRPLEKTIQQNDGSSGGPCMIQNLVNAANGEFVEFDVEHIRRNHMFLLGPHFYEKQLGNCNPIFKNTNTGIQPTMLTTDRNSIDDHQIEQKIDSNPVNNKLQFERLFRTNLINLNKKKYASSNLQ